MKRFKEYIVAESWYYHGTSPETADDILKNGFKKSLHDGKTFMTKNYGEANKYSKIANKGSLGVVLKVNRDNLDSKHIVSDDSGIIQYKGSIHSKHISKA